MSRASDDEFGAVNLLPEWREPVSGQQFLRAGLGSLAVHAVAIAVFFALPSSPAPQETRRIITDLRRATPLYAPKAFDLTQKDPNQGKITKSLDASSFLRPSPPKSKAFRPPSPAGG